MIDRHALLLTLLAALSACATEGTGSAAGNTDSRVAPPTTAAVEVATAADYVRVCGIGHLEEGEGVPGAFPPLDARLAPLLAQDAGRDYLVGILQNGLYGSIEVAGVRYNGAMPPVSGQLDAQGMARMLNYVATTFIGSAATPFSTAEVESRLGAIGATPGAELRAAVADSLATRE